MKVNEIVTEAQQLNEIRGFLKVGEFIWKHIPTSVKKKMPWGKKPDTWDPAEFMQYLEKTGNAKRDLENLIKAVPSVEQLAKMEKKLSDYLKTNTNAAPAGQFLLDLIRIRKQELIKMNQSFTRPDVRPRDDWRNM